jgi:hypothetical protein
MLDTVWQSPRASSAWMSVPGKTLVKYWTSPTSKCWEASRAPQLQSLGQSLAHLIGDQHCELPFPGASGDGNTALLAQERSGALCVLAQVLDKRPPESLDSWMPERVGQVAQVNVMAQLQADGNHELQLIVSYRRLS